MAQYEVKISNDRESFTLVMEDPKEEQLKLLFPLCKIDILSVSQSQEQQIQYLKDFLQKAEEPPK